MQVIKAGTICDLSFLKDSVMFLKVVKPHDKDGNGFLPFRLHILTQ